MTMPNTIDVLDQLVPQLKQEQAALRDGNTRKDVRILELEDQVCELTQALQNALDANASHVEWEATLRSVLRRKTEEGSWQGEQICKLEEELRQKDEQIHRMDEERCRAEESAAWVEEEMKRRDERSKEAIQEVLDEAQIRVDQERQQMLEAEEIARAATRRSSLRGRKLRRTETERDEAQQGRDVEKYRADCLQDLLEAKHADPAQDVW